MDTAIQTAPETNRQSPAQETNKQQSQGGLIMHGVAHVNPLDWEQLDPDDRNYPIGS